MTSSGPVDSSQPVPQSSRSGRLEAITNPGTVKINVKGAFIVDDEPRSKSPVNTDGVHYEHKDIRLPHHKGVVSHVAVDVCPAIITTTTTTTTSPYLITLNPTLD